MKIIIALLYGTITTVILYIFIDRISYWQYRIEEEERNQIEEEKNGISNNNAGESHFIF